MKDSRIDDIVRGLMDRGYGCLKDVLPPLLEMADHYNVMFRSQLAGSLTAAPPGTVLISSEKLSEMRQTIDEQAARIRGLENAVTVAYQKMMEILGTRGGGDPMK